MQDSRETPTTPPSANVSDQVTQPQLPTIEPISWTATDPFVQQRSGHWYGIATAVFVAIATIDVLLCIVFHITDMATMISSLVLFTMMFIALLVSAKLPARTSTYTLSSDGLSINDRHMAFSQFRAFGVRQHGNRWQLVLIPVKRFGMEVVTYINEQEGEKIVDLLASFLPMEEVPENNVDKLIDRLKI